MTSLSIVPLAAADLPFVRAMLYEAASWRGTDGAPSLDAALGDSALGLDVGVEWSGAVGFCQTQVPRMLKPRGVA